MKPLTLADAIEMDFPHALALMRASYWRVANHYDLFDDDGVQKIIVWLFISRNGKFVQSKGFTDGQALFYACLKAEVPLHPSIQCPRCSNWVDSDQGKEIICNQCSITFHLGCWWSLGCDEAHGHGEKCFVLANVKQPHREEDVMLNQPEVASVHRTLLVDFPSLESKYVEEEILS